MKSSCVFLATFFAIVGLSEGNPLRHEADGSKIDVDIIEAVTLNPLQDGNGVSSEPSPAKMKYSAYFYDHSSHLDGGANSASDVKPAELDTIPHLDIAVNIVPKVNDVEDRVHSKSIPSSSGSSQEDAAMRTSYVNIFETSGDTVPKYVIYPPKKTSDRHVEESPRSTELPPSDEFPSNDLSRETADIQVFLDERTEIVTLGLPSKNTSKGQEKESIMIEHSSEASSQIKMRNVFLSTDSAIWAGCALVLICSIIIAALAYSKICRTGPYQE